MVFTTLNIFFYQFVQFKLTSYSNAIVNFNKKKILINLCTISICQNEIDFHVVFIFLAKTLEETASDLDVG